MGGGTYGLDPAQPVASKAEADCLVKVVTLCDTLAIIIIVVVVDYVNVCVVKKPDHSPTFPNMPIFIVNPEMYPGSPLTTIYGIHTAAVTTTNTNTRVAVPLQLPTPCIVSMPLAAFKHSQSSPINRHYLHADASECCENGLLNILCFNRDIVKM